MYYALYRAKFKVSITNKLLLNLEKAVWSLERNKIKVRCPGGKEVFKLFQSVRAYVF